ncbi:MAG TPA: enoyl-CoA hydratase/isomerase family protein [Xanthobacteraceae bacterium]|jgi:enoyl-CoA hydratase|nr:enoyl-CoA hydratase/isomerase family protein [Xanthobacteraceae bacterium]
MTEQIPQDEEILIRQEGLLRRITLNRPKALNAITLNMAVIMTAKLREWANDPSVGAVLIDGAGDRAFAAGGDIRALYDAAKAGDPLPEKFWSIEYHLNVLIARYPKPFIALMDGLVMGGGVGLSAHAAHRVVTDRSTVAMPEVGIGFFPDIGASYLLARAPGEVGTYLALTGSRINGADAIYSGLADIHIRAARLSEIPRALADCRTTDEVVTRLKEFATPPAPGRLAAARNWIDAGFSADRAEEIVARLPKSSDSGAAEALAIMQKASPTSLKITLRNLRDAQRMTRLEQCFQQDYRIALACIGGHDLIEGIRAAIVDKDRNPVWRPNTIEAVTPEIVDRHFEPVDTLELQFD